MAGAASGLAGDAVRPPRLSRLMARGTQAFFDRLPHEARAFTTALPAFDAFPMALWSRHVAKYWRAHRDVVLCYGDTHGLLPLRRAIYIGTPHGRAKGCPYELEP